MELSRWFRLRRRRDDWQTIRTRFVCDGFGEGCGSKDVFVTYELDAPDPPPRPPDACEADYCPKGIDLEEWARADRYERKRLVRRLRN